MAQIESKILIFRVKRGKWDLKSHFFLFSPAVQNRINNLIEPFIVSCTILDTRAKCFQERHWRDSVRLGSCHSNLESH